MQRPAINEQPSMPCVTKVLPRERGDRGVDAALPRNESLEPGYLLLSRLSASDVVTCCVPLPMNGGCSAFLWADGHLGLDGRPIVST